jgi:Spy/CpxP family protein refolding chaperone
MIAFLKTAVVACFFILPALPALAAEPDPVRSQVYEPDEIFRYAREIGLTNDQREKLIMASKAMARRMDRERPRLDRARIILVAVLRGNAPDKAAVRHALSEVLDQEGNIKQAQMAMLIELKALLTPDQIAWLQKQRDTTPAK